MSCPPIISLQKRCVLSTVMSNVDRISVRTKLRITTNPNTDLMQPTGTKPVLLWRWDSVEPQPPIYHFPHAQLHNFPHSHLSVLCQQKQVNAAIQRSVSVAAYSNEYWHFSQVANATRLLATVHFFLVINPSDSKVNYSAISNWYTELVRRWYTGRWWVGCYIWYSEEGTRRGPRYHHCIAIWWSVALRF